MLKIKQKPEDFIVTEISTVETKKDGEFSYFLMKKQDYDTVKAVETIAKALRIPAKYIGYAGNKDKKAITEQVISIFNVDKKRVENLNLKDINLSFLGKGDERINLGDLKGNEFTIIVYTNEQPSKIDFATNYFDEQRFSKSNVEIGRLLVKRDFKKAVELILSNNKEESYFETRIIEHLKKNPTDFIGSLRRIPKNLLRLYIHAYQSFLWNETVKELLESRCKDYKTVKYSVGEFVFPNKIGIQNIKIPIIGFCTELENKEIKDIIQKILAAEKISFRDFIIKGFPEIISEGSERDLFVKVDNLKIEKIDEGFKISFFLQKGSYATIVIKAIFC